MSERDHPDRLPDPYDLESGKIGIENDPKCSCGHAAAAHPCGKCLLCGCQQFKE